MLVKGPSSLLLLYYSCSNKRFTVYFYYRPINKWMKMFQRGEIGWILQIKIERNITHRTIASCHGYMTGKPPQHRCKHSECRSPAVRAENGQPLQKRLWRRILGKPAHGSPKRNHQGVIDMGDPPVHKYVLSHLGARHTACANRYFVTFSFTSIVSHWFTRIDSL